MAKRMGRPKAKNPLKETLLFRVSRSDANRIRHLATLYAKRDLSKWLRHAAINAPRRFLK